MNVSFASADSAFSISPCNSTTSVEFFVSSTTRVWKVVNALAIIPSLLAVGDPERGAIIGLRVGANVGEELVTEVVIADVASADDEEKPDAVGL